MSLINDALKKARTTQLLGAAPGVGGRRPAMRPLPVQRGKRTSFLTLAIAAVVVLLLAAGLLWGWYRAGHGEMVARAKTEKAPAVTTSIAPKATAMPVATEATPAPEVSRAPASMPVVSPPVLEKPKVEPVAPVATADPAPPPMVARATPPPREVHQPIVTTQAEAAPGPVHRAIVHLNANTPKPASHDYKLEGIFYSPKGPSAVIDGELVSVGGDVADGKVVAIDNESVTVLTTAGETNVLVLAR